MATFEKRTNRAGQTVWRVKVRRKGAPTQTATFTKLSEARKWAQMTEGAIIEGPHFPTSEAKRRTVADLINRYVQTVLPQKSASHARMQRQQLRWWRAQLGTYALADITPRVLWCVETNSHGITPPPR